MVGGYIDQDISTKRSTNYAPFDKISKSGDGGHSGDNFLI
jgi:hypothetical protein